jgi:iron complex transport system ATP-binding protein
LDNVLLEVHNLAFAYGDYPVLKSVDLSATGGEFLVLLGLNGAGKSTLLDILAGLHPADSGSVSVDGRPLARWSSLERARLVSHLPQGIRNDLPFTVEQIVLMGRYAHAERWFESEQDQALAASAMERMECLVFRDRIYSTLSGGERQRVLLAACVAQEPQLLLLDEPSTYLDVHQQIQCFSTLAGIARHGALCIAVTHDLNLALAHATRLVVLHEGRIAADLPASQAAEASEWLTCLSPHLLMMQTPEGKPWVLYQ